MPLEMAVPHGTHIQSMSGHKIPKMAIVDDRKTVADYIRRWWGVVGGDLVDLRENFFKDPELIRSLEIVIDDITKARDAELENKFREAIAYYVCAASNIPGIIIKFIIQAAKIHGTPFEKVLGQNQEILRRLGDPKLLSHAFLKDHFKEKDDFYMGCVVLMENRKKLIFRARVIEYHMQWNLLSRSIFYHVIPLPQAWYNPDWLRPLRIETIEAAHCLNCNKPRKHLAHHYVSRRSPCRNCQETKVRIGQKYVDEDNVPLKVGKTRTRIIIGGMAIAKLRMKESSGHRTYCKDTDNVFETQSLHDLIDFFTFKSE